MKEVSLPSTVAYLVWASDPRDVTSREEVVVVAAQKERKQLSASR